MKARENEKKKHVIFEMNVSAIRWPEYECIPLMGARARAIVTATTPWKKKKKKGNIFFQKNETSWNPEGGILLTSWDEFFHESSEITSVLINFESLVDA